ncbi:MAG: signal recognition particle-docking protein FtsY [Methylomonas sp.]|nr:signal recognition particle-docking protein FtsY [Methylomonas sp.]PPD20076.1 MAG: signal recognition particle-docking protein FtsY [Methylomonas sp.]PPD25983.1 MAG: signal recognition particle-docking protein FtsY [Methylomonas sp.]PPD37712.1 MAG: signal recognition particle-docking protein FtsY [Methylomonas sp.]PPD39608.1 MAG: signal recognition particle-docking protein FtsY [Methylomonas sp.]
MFRKWLVLGAILALIVIVMGAYVRLSDAGLGCPDWPGCYGRAMISDNPEFKAHAESLFPESPLETAKAWKEMGHRYLAGALSIVALTLFGLAFRLQQARATAVKCITAILLLFAAQAALGMWTVTMNVMPIIVSMHLLLGFITFWAFAATWLWTTPNAVRRSVNQGPVGFAAFTMAVLLVQIALGAWVSTNYAALACADFPRCNGQWLPDADFRTALDIFHGLKTGDSGVLPPDAKIAAHWLHRVGALVTFIVIMSLILIATSEDKPKGVRRSGVLLSMLMLVQVASGIANIKHGLPLWSALGHNLVAALMMLPLLGMQFFSRYALTADEAGIEPAEAATAITVEVEPAPTSESVYRRLRSQLQKTRSNIGGLFSGLIGSSGAVNNAVETIESHLLMADVGIETTQKITDYLKSTLDREQLDDGEQLSSALKTRLLEVLQPCSQPLTIQKPDDGPFVVLVVGVNGVGKTTSIGKLAKRLQDQGHSVMLAAGDTFRAAAVEQLQTWGERNQVQVVAQHTGADSASVIFDALQSAKAKGVDVLIADTAGRLHTKANLMDELKKIKRIMAKIDGSAPHEVLLVLDAGTGQNALSQARLFNEAVNLTGIALTKLDGTAKGGVIFALADQLGVPIRFIGVGEAITDFQDFDAKTFVDALFAKD